MRLFACCLALALAPMASAHAAAPPCRPLLTIAAADAQQPVPPMTTCDFDVLIGAGAQGGLALRPRGPALQSLADALGPQGRFFSPMLLARLRLEPVAGAHALAGVPGGLLLASESARLIPEGHWRWFRSERMLRWMPPTGRAGRRVVLT
jgi:hypothetical protein